MPTRRVGSAHAPAAVAVSAVEAKPVARPLIQPAGRPRTDGFGANARKSAADALGARGGVGHVPGTMALGTTRASSTKIHTLATRADFNKLSSQATVGSPGTELEFAL